MYHVNGTLLAPIALHMAANFASYTQGEHRGPAFEKRRAHIANTRSTNAQIQTHAPAAAATAVGVAVESDRGKDSERLPAWRVERLENFLKDDG